LPIPAAIVSARSLSRSSAMSGSGETSISTFFRISERVLFAFGAPVDVLDGMFAATPLVWAVEGWTHARPGSDHVRAAQLILAGSPTDWVRPAGTPDPEATLQMLIDLRRRSAADESA
jgi:hypothetical protein